MIERNNPELDVDDLMVRVQVEAARHRFGIDADLFGLPIASLDSTIFDAQLGIAQQRAEARRSWSSRLDVFPCNRLRWLEAAALRTYNFLFRDQRHVNFALIAAARELLQMNRELNERLAVLEAHVRELEQRGDTKARYRDG